jgi:hypothetical protein
VYDEGAAMTDTELAFAVLALMLAGMGRRWRP